MGIVAIILGIAVLLSSVAWFAFKIPLENVVPATEGVVGSVTVALQQVANVVLEHIHRWPRVLLDGYGERMKTAQPFENDRILEGVGKHHAVDAMANADDTNIPAVFSQVGDTFS